MDIQQVVREVTVRGQVQGMDQVARAYGQVSASANDTSAALAKSGSSAAIAEAAIAKLGVQLQDNFQQQQQFNDAMRQQAQALQQTIIAANDNSVSAKSNGLEWAEAANHLRQATEAAYAFSPAFRGVVNAMAVPLIAAAGTALEATAAGMVVATNYAGTGLIRLGTAAAAAVPALAPVGTAVASAGAAMEAFSPSLTGVATNILSKLLPALRLLGAIGFVVDAVKMVGEAWELGGQKLQEWIDIANKAAKVDLTTDFFQRITKAATDTKLSVEDLTAAFTKLGQASQEHLAELGAGQTQSGPGTSALQSRLDQLRKAGNFQGNSGVDQLAQASTTQAKFEAIVALIDQAMQKGERLAALDLANTAFGPAITDRLRVDGDYLDRLLASAEKIEATELVSNDDIARALELQNRYDAATKILEQRWHPIQDLLTAGGIKMHEVWVDIVSAIAQAFDWVVKLAEKTAAALAPISDFLKSAAHTYLTVVSYVAPPLAGPLGPAFGIAAGIGAKLTAPSDVTATDAYTSAVNRLSAGLKNANTVQQAVAQTNAVQSAVWKDTSHAIVTAQAEVNDAVDRAINSLQKHIEQQKADALAVGLGDRALAAYRAQAVETAAVQANGGKETAEQAAKFAQLKTEAAEAADTLARVKVASQIEWTQKTMFLSPADLQIAQQLKGIYGNDIPAAMASTEAAAMRINNAVKECTDTAKNLGGAFANNLVSGIMSGKSAMEALTSAANDLGKSLTNAGINNIIKDPTSPVGYVETGIGLITQALTGDDKAKKELQEAQDAWAKMAGEVQKFNLAAGGIDLGPLTQQIQSLYATAVQLEQAAIKAHDMAGAARIDDTLSKGVSRIIDEFESGNTLSALQKSIKAVNDEAEGLVETAAEARQTNEYAAGIMASAAAQVKALVNQFADSITTGLQQRLNAASGNDYLNSAQAVLTQHQQDLANAAELGNDPTMLAQISATFGAEAQKVVEDAGLVGDSFNDFIKLFPDFAGVVTQSATAMKALTKTVSDYLDSLKVGSDSILSPQDQLGAAQSQFSRELALAQGGDKDAVSSITSYASTLLDQAKSYYASSSGYADIYQAVTAALAGLIGSSPQVSVGPSTQIAAVDSTSSSLSAMTFNQSGIVAPQVAASNDNGQYFATQTQSLVTAIGAATTAEIQALQDGIAALSQRLDRIATAVESNRNKPARPAQRLAS